MTAIEVLEQLSDNTRRINYYNAEIRIIRQDAATLKGIAYGGTPGGGGPNDLSGVVAHLVDAERDLQAEIKRRGEIKEKARRLLHRIPDATAAAVLVVRYVDARDWAGVEAVVHYSRPHLLKYHDQGVEYLTDAPELLDALRDLIS